MVLVKRERSITPENALIVHHVPSPDGLNSPEDLRDAKPDITPSKKKKYTSPRQPKATAKAKATPKADASPGPKQTQKAWTPEEEAAFIAIVERMGKDHLWSYAKEEEVIAHRGNAGVRAHWTAMANKLKRG